MYMVNGSLTTILRLPSWTKLFCYLGFFVLAWDIYNSYKSIKAIRKLNERFFEVEVKKRKLNEKRRI